MLGAIRNEYRCERLNVNKILLITLSNIGDVILTTPTLKALNLSYPNAKIDLVCDKRSAELFEYCPYVDHVFIKEKNSGITSNLRFVLALRNTVYDIAVDLRTDVLLKFVRAKQKFCKLPNHKSLHLHSAEKHFSAIKAVSTVPIPTTTLWASPVIEQKIQSLIFSIKHKRILALGLGANFDGKIWPVQSYAELSQKLAQYFDVVVLLGSAKEKFLSAQFMAQSTSPTLDFCGKLTLIETFELLRNVAYFAGNDSGLGHLASAANIPTFTIFGPGSPSRYLPWSQKATFYQAPNNDITEVNSTTIARLITQHLKQPQHFSHSVMSL